MNSCLPLHFYFYLPFIVYSSSLSTNPKNGHCSTTFRHPPMPKETFASLEMQHTPLLLTLVSQERSLTPSDFRHLYPTFSTQFIARLMKDPRLRRRLRNRRCAPTLRPANTLLNQIRLGYKVCIPCLRRSPSTQVAGLGEEITRTGTYITT